LELGLDSYRLFPDRTRAISPPDRKSSGTFEEYPGDQCMINLDRKFRAEFLLFTLLFFFIASPFLEGNQAGEFLLVLTLYLTLVAATLQLADHQALFRSAIPMAGISMLLILYSHFHRLRPLLIVSSLILCLFLGLVCIALFNYLGRTAPVTRGRLSVSVSLYFLIGMCWYALYDALNNFQSGSFAMNGVTLYGRVYPSTLLYFSLATLTTLGYGDVVAVTPAARMFATLEAAAGVLYIAITVARLIGGNQGSTVSD
jgi:Ion channel